MPELYPAQPPLKEAKWARARSRDDCFCILSLFLTQDLNVGWPGRLKWVIGWSGHERADTKWSHPCWGASLPPPWYCTHTHTKKPLLNTILPFFSLCRPQFFHPWPPCFDCRLCPFLRLLPHEAATMMRFSSRTCTLLHTADITFAASWEPTGIPINTHTRHLCCLG